MSHTSDPVPRRQQSISMTSLCNPTNESPSRNNKHTNPMFTIDYNNAPNRRVTRSAASSSPVPPPEALQNPQTKRSRDQYRPHEYPPQPSKQEPLNSTHFRYSMSNVRTVHPIPEEPLLPSEANVSYPDWSHHHHLSHGSRASLVSQSSASSNYSDSGLRRATARSLSISGMQNERDDQGFDSDHDETMTEAISLGMHNDLRRKGSDASDGADEFDILGRKKPKNPRTPQSWDPKDDQRLKHLKEVQKMGWKEIASHFPGRTSHACQFRWRRLNSGTLKYYGGQRRVPQLPMIAPGKTSMMSAHQIAPAATPQSMSPTPSIRTMGSGGSRGISSTSTSPLLYHSSLSYPSSRAPYLPSPATWSQGSASTFQSPLSLPNSPLSVDVERRTSYIGHQSIAASSTTQTSATSPQSTGPQTPGVEDNANGPNSLPSFQTFLGSTRHGLDPKRFTSATHDVATTVSSEGAAEWTREEDALLCRAGLSFDELSVLLPRRSNNDIWSRMADLRWRDSSGPEQDARHLRSDSKLRTSARSSPPTGYSHLPSPEAGRLSSSILDSQTHPRVLKKLPVNELPPLLDAVDAREIRSHRGDWSEYRLSGPA